jgi:hypothetical protein
VTSVISGVVGYGVNEYTRDRKVFEVLTRSSGNLASVPIAASSNLDIMLQTPKGKEPIKSLVRYEVRISNRSEQGADDFNVFLDTPGSIELVETPTITTVPPELRNAVVTKTTRGPSGNYQLTVNLLNPSQSITVGYLGFSRTEFLTNALPLNVVVSKKDWTQRNVADEATSDSRLPHWLISLGAGVLLLGTAILAFFDIRSILKWRKELKANLEAASETMRRIGAQRDAAIAERNELHECLSRLAPVAEVHSQ